MKITPFELVFGQPPRSVIFPGISTKEIQEEDVEDILYESDDNDKEQYHMREEQQQYNLEYDEERQLYDIREEHQQYDLQYEDEDRQQYDMGEEQQQYDLQYEDEDRQQYDTEEERQQYDTEEEQQQYVTEEGQQQYDTDEERQQYDKEEEWQQYHTEEERPQYDTEERQQYDKEEERQQYDTDEEWQQYEAEEQQQYDIEGQQRYGLEYDDEERQQYETDSSNEDFHRQSLASTSKHSLLRKKADIHYRANAERMQLKYAKARKKRSWHFQWETMSVCAFPGLTAHPPIPIVLLVLLWSVLVLSFICTNSGVLLEFLSKHMVKEISSCSKEC